jgi:hypothetical protein
MLCFSISPKKPEMDDEICKQSFRVATDFAVELVRVLSDTQRQRVLPTKMTTFNPGIATEHLFFAQTTFISLFPHTLGERDSLIMVPTTDDQHFFVNYLFTLENEV